MIASRLAKSLANWKCLEKKLSEILKNQLIRISKNKDISNDLREIVNKSLI
jgi:predicted transcriptional regulator